VKGVNDTKNLTEKKYEVPVHHMNSIYLSMSGKQNIASCLDSLFKGNVKNHNIQVSKNRHILKRLISCVKFCAVFEMALTSRIQKCIRGSLITQLNWMQQ
jgi:hypothetical protein